MDCTPKSHSQSTADCFSGGKKNTAILAGAHAGSVAGGNDIAQPDCVLDEWVRAFALIFIFPGRMRVKGFNSCWVFGCFFLKVTQL